MHKQLAVLKLIALMIVGLTVACSDADSGSPLFDAVSGLPNVDIEVFPSGDASADVQNVKAAKVMGGTVYLQAQDETGVQRPFDLDDSVSKTTE